MKTKKDLINSWIKKAEKDLLEPTLEEAKEAFEIANKMRRFILSRITL